MRWVNGLWRRLAKHADIGSSGGVFPAFVSVGASCAIDPSVQFREHDGQSIRIGDCVTIFRNTELCGDIAIGPRTFLNRDVYIRPHTHIGQNVSIGPFVQLVTDSHELSNVGRRAGRTTHEPIHIGDGVWIGAGAIVLGGVTIGRGAVIGAGAVVTNDVEADSLYVGTPARKIRSLPPLIDTPRGPLAEDDNRRPPHHPKPARRAA